jgi:hypothetical protein
MIATALDAAISDENRFDMCMNLRRWMGRSEEPAVKALIARLLEWQETRTEVTDLVHHGNLNAPAGAINLRNPRI